MQQPDHQDLFPTGVRALGDWSVIQSLVVLSSSETARQAAGVWLAAFEAARAAGASEADAHARANLAWRNSVAQDSGAASDRPSMLAGTPGSWTDARPPPVLVA
jgi:hypothetical protein